jgi:hypothetical protein
MALQKEIETPFGVQAVYWRIIKKNEDYEINTVYIVLAGYATKEDRDENKNPLDIRNFAFEGAEKTRAEIYGLIKEHAVAEEEQETTEFANSQDV